MNNPKATRDVSNDELAVRILKKLDSHDLTHDEAIALGDRPEHAASVLASLQATGLIEAYCGPIQPSTCRYRLTGKG